MAKGRKGASGLIYNGQVLRSLPVNLSKLVCKGTKSMNLQENVILKLTILRENAILKSPVAITQRGITFILSCCEDQYPKQFGILEE